MPFHRRRFDIQPTNPVEVMLASDGRQDYSRAAVARAAALSPSGPVAVVTIAKIYGSSFGLPHPGLLPTKAELDERRGWVEAAVGTLKAGGTTADGQVAATRRAAKKLAAVARARGARVIVIDETTVSNPLRRLIEGDVGAELRRKLRKDGVEVEVVPHDRPAARPDLCTSCGSPTSGGVARRGPGAHAAREPVLLLLGLDVEDGCDRLDQLCHVSPSGGRMVNTSAIKQIVLTGIIRKQCFMVTRAAQAADPVHRDRRASTSLDRALNGLFWGDNVVFAADDAADVEPFFRAVAAQAALYEARPSSRSCGSRRARAGRTRASSSSMRRVEGAARAAAAAARCDRGALRRRAAASYSCSTRSRR